MSYQLLNADEAYWRPSNLMGVLNTDLAKQVGSETLGAWLWRIAPGQASTRHDDRAVCTHLVAPALARYATPPHQHRRHRRASPAARQPTCGRPFARIPGNPHPRLSRNPRPPGAHEWRRYNESGPARTVVDPAPPGVDPARPPIDPGPPGVILCRPHQGHADLYNIPTEAPQRPGGTLPTTVVGNVPESLADASVGTLYRRFLASPEPVNPSGTASTHRGR